VNLADARRDYQQILAGLAHLAASGEELPEGNVLEAERHLDAVRKKAMRSIDQYTTRRFLSVNTRRGLTSKLERLHQQAHAELRAIAAGQQVPGTSR
jgi:hypothetical protein